MSLPSQIFRAKLSPENKVLHDWIYEASRDGAFSTMLLGCLGAIASNNPDATYWECVAEAKKVLEAN